jgi:hypothetical protein
VSRLVRGAGGLMPEHYATPVWCQWCLSEPVSDVSQPCAECAIEAEEDKEIPDFDTREEGEAVYGR